MMKKIHLLLISLILSVAASNCLAAEAPKVIFQTTAGKIVIELNPAKAPKSVENFIQYAKDGFYNNTIFHRVISGFMVQGGGFTETFSQKPVRAPIKNEADNGLSNARGSIAMARTNNPNSATAQFFINLVDNNFLNHTAPTPRGWGYAVFGQVIEGMDVVDKIATVRTGRKNGHSNVPLNNIVITATEVIQ